MHRASQNPRIALEEETDRKRWRTPVPFSVAQRGHVGLQARHVPEQRPCAIDADRDPRTPNLECIRCSRSRAVRRPWCTALYSSQWRLHSMWYMANRTLRIMCGMCHVVHCIHGVSAHTILYGMLCLVHRTPECQHVVVITRTYR